MGELNDVEAPLEQRTDRSRGIAAIVPSFNVGGGPQPLADRDGRVEHAIGREKSRHFVAESFRMLDMLDYIECANTTKASGAHPSVLERGAHHDWQVAPKPRVARSPLAGLEEYGIEAVGEQSLGDEAISAADVQEDARRWMSRNQCSNAVIPMTKPVRAFLQIKGEVVLCILIRDRSNPFSPKDSVLRLGQAIRELSDVHVCRAKTAAASVPPHWVR